MGPPCCYVRRFCSVSAFDYSSTRRRIPNMRRRQKPRNPEPFTTTIFITAPSFPYVKSAAAQKGDSQRHNNHCREKQHQLYGTKACNCKPQPKGNGVHSPASGKSGAGIGTAYFSHLESPPFPYRLFYCIHLALKVCRVLKDWQRFFSIQGTCKTKDRMIAISPGLYHSSLQNGKCRNLLDKLTVLVI